MWALLATGSADTVHFRETAELGRVAADAAHREPAGRPGRRGRMSRYLLDTGVLNAFLRGRPGAVALVDPWLAAGDAATSILVFGEIVEFLQGLPKPDYERREAELHEVLRDIHPL